MILARCFADSPAHLGNARLAALTAASISASAPAATSARISPVAGLRFSKNALLSTGPPSMRCLIIAPLSRSCSFGQRFVADDGVHQPADAADLRDYLVARMHAHQSLGCPGEDDIAGRK